MDGEFRHHRFLRHLKREIKPGARAFVARYVVEEYAPHFWREEAKTLGGWFANNAGSIAYELKVFERPNGDFEVEHAAR